MARTHPFARVRAASPLSLVASQSCKAAVRPAWYGTPVGARPAVTSPRGKRPPSVFSAFPLPFMPRLTRPNFGSEASPMKTAEPEFLPQACDTTGDFETPSETHPGPSTETWRAALRSQLFARAH